MRTDGKSNHARLLNNAPGRLQNVYLEIPECLCGAEVGSQAGFTIRHVLIPRRLIFTGTMRKSGAQPDELPSDASGRQFNSVVVCGDGLVLVSRQRPNFGVRDEW